jgi:enoyl-CoA hydratase/carnithine racemase
VTVDYELDQSVARIYLNRPHRLNAVVPELTAGLVTALGRAGQDGARVVILAGRGRAFCSGFDLKEPVPAETVLATRIRVDGIQEVTRAIRRFPGPVIAAVHGYALGGGCELALNCDLVVADETAQFGLPEATVGLVPGCGGTQLSMRRLGVGRAADLLLTGRRVKAAEAERIGLADRLVPAGTADATALEMAGAIAANSPVAVRAAKRAMRQGWGVGLAAALDIEDAAWRTAALSADRREGIAAFTEKRDPIWPGE